jgi:hypothetical protein
MIRLSKTISKKNFRTENKGVEIRTRIQVKYDPSDHSVEIDSIIAEEVPFYYNNCVYTFSLMSATVDLTILLDHFTSIEQEIMGLDWESEYREYLAERRVA